MSEIPEGTGTEDSDLTMPDDQDGDVTASLAFLSDAGELDSFLALLKEMGVPRESLVVTDTGLSED